MGGMTDARPNGGGGGGGIFKPMFSETGGGTGIGMGGGTIVGVGGKSGDEGGSEPEGP